MLGKLLYRGEKLCIAMGGPAWRRKDLIAGKKRHDRYETSWTEGKDDGLKAKSIKGGGSNGEVPAGQALGGAQDSKEKGTALPREAEVLAS